MGGNVDRVKERLDIVEVISPYLKLEKAGINWKARCPFHNEKTPSFFVSPARQSYYCFGCGAKGDIFTFIEEMEGTDFKGALKELAEKAGIELAPESPASSREKALKEELLSVLDAATNFFESELEKSPEAKKYLQSRGMRGESVSTFRLGWAPDEWRSLYLNLSSLGFQKKEIMLAGLAKISENKENKDPYDVFRGRIIFPLADAGGRIVGFSGRALSKDTEPKYLNTPETILFNKSELLYGLDKAKDDIRRKNYAILVEGQMDLVMSHQAGVRNTVASSGTAFTQPHLERLKKMSPRIVLAFDADDAGRSAAEKSATLALSLGMEVKVAKLPKDSDPAELARNPEAWKDALRKSLPAIEHFLAEAIEEEKDARKRGKLIERKILPLISLLPSAIERAHYVSLIAKKTGIKEETIWEDLKNVKVKGFDLSARTARAVTAGMDENLPISLEQKPLKEAIEERLAELAAWKKELAAGAQELSLIDKEEAELAGRLRKADLREELKSLNAELLRVEEMKDQSAVSRLSEKAAKLHKDLRALEEYKG